MSRNGPYTLLPFPSNNQILKVVKHTILMCYMLGWSCSKLSSTHVRPMFFFYNATRFQLITAWQKRLKWTGTLELHLWNAFFVKTYSYCSKTMHGMVSYMQKYCWNRYSWTTTYILTGNSQSQRLTFLNTFLNNSLFQRLISIFPSITRSFQV